MTNALTWSSAMLNPVLPELCLAVGAMVLLILGVFQGNGATRVISYAAILLALCCGLLSVVGGWDTQVAFNNMFIIDPFAGTLKAIILIGLALALALAIDYIEEKNIARFEYPVLVLLAGLGMLMMVSANDLLAMYLGLELQSLSLYVLVSIRRDFVKSSEAGLKYFILGALSSGFILFGASILYGFTGTLNFDVMADALADDLLPPAILVGLVFVLCGLAFKISAVPFHMWTPDVYQGAPSSVTALLALVPKIAALGLLARILYGPFYEFIPDWQQIIFALSTLSMIWAAYAGIAQSNIKRLLAYSTIGNMGYTLVGIAAASASGLSASLLFMIIYMATSAGVFGAFLSLQMHGRVVTRMEDYAGLSKTHPAMAYTMAAFLFSLIGIPPAAGFFGKYIVFAAAVQQGLYVLAVIGVLTSVVAAFYYLRLIKLMFFDVGDEQVEAVLPAARKIVIILSMLFVMGFWLILEPLYEVVDLAVASLILQTL